MAFDNTLWSGKVLNPESRVNDKDTETMHAFNEYVRDFDGVDVVLLPIRDGLTLIRKH